MNGQKYKKRVLEVIEQKQLCSIMNDTKWEKLQRAVLDRLPFPPPYQAKYVAEDMPDHENFETDVSYHGDWIEGLYPFYSVEWIRVRPTYSKHRGFLVSDEIIDISEEFHSLLIELRIPYKKEKDTYFIYGYISNPESLSIGE